MFFRRTGAFFNPTHAFQNGAKSVSYMGVEFTRRHCASTRSSMVRGFVDPKSFLSANASVGAAVTVVSSLASQATAMRAVSMSAVEDLDVTLLNAIVEQHVSTPFSLLSFYVPSGCSCGTVPLTRLMMLEEFSPYTSSASDDDETARKEE